MTYEDFKLSLKDESPPEGIPALLKALWYDAKDDWEKAHRITQDEDTTEAAWVHAYLHRKEGDKGNAGYWYSRANKPFPDVTLDEEREIITKILLNN